MAFKNDTVKKTFDALGVLIRDADFDGIATSDIHSARNLLDAVIKLRVEKAKRDEVLEKVKKEVVERAEGYTHGEGRSALNGVVRWLDDELKKDV